MITELCFVPGLHGERRGRSGKLDPNKKIAEHEQMNVLRRAFESRGQNCGSRFIVRVLLFKPGSLSPFNGRPQLKLITLSELYC